MVEPRPDRLSYRFTRLTRFTRFTPTCWNGDAFH